MSDAYITKQFALWSHELNLNDVPNAVVINARRAIFDTIGVMIAGAAHPLLDKLASGLPVKKGCCSTVNIGLSDAETAALINATAAHVWDFDDTSYTGIMHGSAVVLPIVLALIEESGANEDELFAAFIVGSEIAYTLADICTHEHYFSGWWSTITFGLVGGTVAAARILGLSEEQTQHAISLAAASACGGKAVFGYDAKPYLVGDTARRSIGFARAAKMGLSGPLDAFENTNGYFSLLNNGTAHTEAIETIGERWRLTEPGLLHKTSPVCSAAHAAIEQMRLIMQQVDVDLKDIISIHAEVPTLVMRSLIYPQPVSVQQAQFSLPYALACAAMHGSVLLSDLTTAQINADQKIALMKKVTTIEAEDLSTEKMRRRYPESTRLSVYFTDGSVIRGFCGEAYGMPQRPLSNEDLQKKFSSCLEFADQIPLDKPVLDKPLLDLVAEFFRY